MSKKIVYTVNINHEFCSKEVAFSGKPSEAVRAFLKAHRFKWNAQGGFWYGYMYMEDLTQELDHYYERVSELPQKRTSWNSKKAERAEKARRDREEYQKYCDEQEELLRTLGGDGYDKYIAEKWADSAPVDSAPSDFPEHFFEPDEWGMYEI